MKNENMLKLTNLIDDDLINEANPDKIKPKRKNVALMKAIALCASFVIIFSAVLGALPFIFNDTDDVPSDNTPPIVSDSDNSYDKIYTALNKFFKSKENNADNVFLPSLNPDFIEDSNSTNSDGSSGENSLYNEITDNQVQGVTEGDLIKRSDKYIFYLKNTTLCVYSIEKDSSKLVGSVEIHKFISKDYSYPDTNSFEIFLSPDCKYITVFAPYDASYGSHTAFTNVISINVENPEKPEIVKTISVRGRYSSARYVDDDFLLFTIFDVNSGCNEDIPETYIPSIDTGDGYQLIDTSNIVYPKKLSSCSYSVITRIEENTLEIKDSLALLSYSSHVYVSKNSIYLTRAYDNTFSTFLSSSSRAMTAITKIDYGNDKLVVGNTINLNGYIKDQYSLDEYEGALRVATTIEEYTSKKIGSTSTRQSCVSASLYIVDISTMKLITSVEKFAPENETIKAVRFDKDNAYVCTSVAFTDPVFFFDLGDINNITYTDTGVIDGFSSSLIQLNDGYLLGIGRNNWSSLKLEIYKSNGSTVEIINTLELNNAYFSTSYKSYYIDRENGLLGLGVTSYGENYLEYYDKYLVVKIDNGTINIILNETLRGTLSCYRGVYIDGYYYMFGNGSEPSFKVIKIQ